MSNELFLAAWSSHSKRRDFDRHRFGSKPARAILLFPGKDILPHLAFLTSSFKFLVFL